MKKRTLNLTNSFISAGLLLAVLVVINVIASIFSFKGDLTKNSKYSVGRPTKELLSKLPAKVIVKAYFSSNINPEVTEDTRYLENFLMEMAGYSKGRLKIEFCDPSRLDDSEKAKLEQSGIVPLQFRVRKNYKYEAAIVYQGLIINYLNKQEVIPAILNIRTFEYEMYLKIAKLIEYKVKTLGLVNLNEEQQNPYMQYQKQSKLGNLIGSLEQLYNVKQLEIKDAVIDPSIETILVLGGSKELNETELLALDQYIIAGKPICFIMGSRKVDIMNNSVSPINKNLLEFLAAYGLKLGNELIYDEENEKVQIKTFFFPIVVNYPYFVSVSNINKKHPITNGLGKVAFPFANKIIADGEIKLEALLKTSTKSYEYTAADLNPTKKIEPPKNAKAESSIIAAVCSGNIKSYFKGKKLPVKDYRLKDSGYNDKMVIFSSMEAAENSLFALNSNLFLNSVDWCEKNEDMINIRNKNIDVGRLKEVSQLTKDIVKYSNILLAPFLLAIIGLIRFRTRRKMEVKSYEKSR